MPKIESLAVLELACARKNIEYLGNAENLAAGLMKSRVQLRCLTCLHKWTATANNVSRPGPKSAGCPACAGRAKGALLAGRGEGRFVSECGGLGYEVLGAYSSAQGKVDLRCRADGAEFSVAPVNLYGGQRCPVCSGNSQDVSPERLIRSVTEGTTWTLAGPVPGRGASARMVCSSCDQERTVGWDHMLKLSKWKLARRHCGCRRYGEEYEEYVETLPGYTLLGSYTKAKVPILHRHDKCGHVWPCCPESFRDPSGTGTRCPKCSRSGRSSAGQRELAAFVAGLGLEVQENVPGLYSSRRKEVDIFIPSAKVAIEFDGVWYHREGSSRNIAPTEARDRAFELAGAGIQTVRIFSDEWANRRVAVCSRLRAILGRPESSIGARSLAPDPGVPPHEARAALATWHSQGSSPNQQAAVGLRRKDGSLAALMTFGERSLGPAGGSHLELLRFCCAPGLSVPGGASRLLAVFLRSYDTSASSRLVTYADLRWTPVWGSKMYEALGFRLGGREKPYPSYAYVHPSAGNRRISRMALQKHKMLAQNPGADPGLTEGEIAATLGYSRVWDCGCLSYELDLAPANAAAGRVAGSATSE
jgi:hypothetical protein